MCCGVLQELGGAPPEELAGLVPGRGRPGLGHHERDRDRYAGRQCVGGWSGLPSNNGALQSSSAQSTVHGYDEGRNRMLDCADSVLCCTMLRCAGLPTGAENGSVRHLVLTPAICTSGTLHHTSLNPCWRGCSAAAERYVIRLHCVGVLCM
jgi:hypothetical protein